MAEDRAKISSEAITIPINAAVPASGAVRGHDFMVGTVQTPTAWTSASMAFKVCDKADGTFVPLRDESGALVEISGIVTNAAGAYRLPAALQSAQYFIPWSETSGSDVTQAAARLLVFHLKG